MIRLARSIAWLYMQRMAGRAGKGRAAERIAAECIAVRLRMLNRRITRLYDDALREQGLGIAQLNMLVAIAKAGEVSPVALGEALDLEKSTLSRNVARMRERGWVVVEQAGSGPGQRLSLTAEGLALLDAVEPAWAEAQGQARALLGAALGGELERVRVRGA